MRYEKVIIKQIPDANPTAINLDKYNRSRFPNCVDIFYPSQVDDGRYVTGIDPNGPDIEAIKDYDDREKARAERKEIFDYISKTLPNVDFSPTSEYWATFRVKIDSNQQITLNKSNPIDVIRYHMLIANGFVAPTIEATSHPAYLSSNYYCHVEEVETQKNVSSQKLSDKARGELGKLDENKDMLLLIGSYLEGTKYKKTMSANTLYLLLSDFINDKKNPENPSLFLKAVKTPIDELQYKVTIETAIRKKIIKFKDGQYYRGGTNLGKNATDVLKNLKSPDFANEFIQIHEELNFTR